MLNQKKQGRPMASRNVKVTPEFRENPDIEQLGRALIAVAMSIAQKKETEEAAKAAQTASEEKTKDTMT